jgi:hypothetical protein
MSLARVADDATGLDPDLGDGFAGIGHTTLNLTVRELPAATQRVARTLLIA